MWGPLRVARSMLENGGWGCWTSSTAAGDFNHVADAVHKRGFSFLSHVGRTRGKKWSGVEMLSGSWLPASRILVVGVTVEEIRDNLQHWLEKAYFIARHSTEDTQPLHLHSALPLLLKSKPVLPGEIGLVPMVGRQGCDGVMRMLERVCCRSGSCRIDRIASEMI